MTTTTVDVPKTSRAAVLSRFGEPLEIRDLPIPTKLEQGALLVRIEAASVCGSDVHLWNGTLGGSQAMELPVIPGHEMVGSIVRFGEKAQQDSFGTQLSLGDRILFTHASCGKCFQCTLTNEPTLCTNRKYYMFTNCERPPYLVGGFAEYCYVFPESGRVKVPDDVSTPWASAASCALRTVVHSFDRVGRIEPWQTVVIQGSGPLGLFATALAKQSGAGRIVVVGAPDDRLKIAKSFGADDIISVEQLPDPASRPAAVRELLTGHGADVVFEFSGARTAFTEGLAMVRDGGRYMVTGQIDRPGQEVPLSPGYITRHQIDVLGTWSGHIAEYWKALQFMSVTKGRYDFDLLVPNRYRLDQVTDALTKMRAQQDIKPIVIPHEH
jgi:D-arabinose 1-dehydrogenase-like Zn-dependent alcohol dehydrogenase